MTVVVFLNGTKIAGLLLNRIERCIPVEDQILKGKPHSILGKQEFTDRTSHVTTFLRIVQSFRNRRNSDRKPLTTHET